MLLPNGFGPRTITNKNKGDEQNKGFIGENYLSLSSAEEVQAHGRYEDEPLYLFIASNGAGEGYAYDTESADLPIINALFIGLNEPPRLMGRSVLEFLERLYTRPLFDE